MTIPKTLLKKSIWSERDTNDVDMGEDFERLLKQQGFAFLSINPMFNQSGEIPQNTEWSIVFSTIKAEIETMVTSFLPVLKRTGTPFRIVKNKRMAELSIDGNLGEELLGKILIAYPNDIDSFSTIYNFGKDKPFKGPQPKHSFPILDYMYAAPNMNSTIFTKNYSKGKIHRLLEKGWPLEIDSVHCPLAEATNKNPAGAKIIEIISNHSKGRVFAALKYCWPFSIKKVLVKEGKKNMWADVWTRDIQTRLLWQHQQLIMLKEVIPVPQVLDIFYFQNNLYLTTEFIKGKSLQQWVHEIFRFRPIYEQSEGEIQRIISLFVKLLKIVEALHSSGVIHRDLSPGNILITKTDNIYLIDFELSYSVTNKQPTPPYSGGTSGFISPQQQQNRTPDFSDDIFSLGSMGIVFFTGLVPFAFNCDDSSIFFQQLQFFIQIDTITQTLLACRNQNAFLRPDLKTVITRFESLKLSPRRRTAHESRRNISSAEIESLIRAVVKNFSLNDNYSNEGVWTSKILTDSSIGSNKPQRSHYLGLYHGIGGIIVALAKATPLISNQKEIADVIEQAIKAVRSIQNEGNATNDSLLNGTAGFDMATRYAVYKGLIAETVCQPILEVEQESITSCDFSFGTGLLGKKYAFSAFRFQKEQNQVLKNDKILAGQLFSYVTKVLFGKKFSDPIQFLDRIGVHNGVGGILIYLAEYYKKQHDEEIEKYAFQIISFTNSKIRKHKEWMQSAPNYNSFLYGLPGYIFGIGTITKCLPKSIPQCEIDDLLQLITATPLYYDPTIENGISGLGLAYIELEKAYPSADLALRIDWCFDFLCHTQRKGDKGAIFWAVDQFSGIELDLFTGIGGVLVFLVNYRNRGKIVNEDMFI